MTAQMEKSYTLSELKALQEIGVGQKHDPASTVSNWIGAHGPGGLLSGAGVRPDMFATIPQIVGLSDVIPLIASRNHNEILEILTGVTGGEGTRATDICSEGPTPGKLKVCRRTVPFGEMKIDTTVERITSFGRRIDYSDMDRNVLNLQGLNEPLMPSVLNSNNVNTNTGKLFYELGYAVKRSYSVMDIQGTAGSTSNASDFSPWISQYNGLDQLIATGHTDSVTTVACPAADSAIFTHNAAISAAGTNGLTFIANMVSAIRSVMQRAVDVGMGDFQFAVVMHPNAAWAVYDVWACSYYTDRCAGAAASPNNTDAAGIVALRDQMRRGQFLLVDGMQIPVLYAHGMQWAGVSNNTFNTDIYIVPLSWRGRPLLFRQYFPLNNSDAVGFFNGVVDQGPRIINNGMYAVGKRTTNEFCTKYEFIGQSRLILDTPFLAARVNDVQLTYTVTGFDPYVGQSNYRDGGQSTRW